MSFTTLPASESPFDPLAFRVALGQYVTGVAIVTTVDAAGRPYGMTINSFASVSLEPPLLLWSVQLSTPSSKIFAQAPYFAFSVLGADQEALAHRFSRTEDDKYRDLTVHPGIGGVPLIPGAIATFECAAWAVYPGGDHDIIVGRVERFSSRPGPALGFHQGRFLSIAAPQL